MKDWDIDLQDGFSGLLMLGMAVGLFPTNPPLAAVGIVAGCYALYTSISFDGPTGV